MSFGGGDLDNTTQIQGPDGTVIGNLGDRLKVDASINSVPVTNILWINDTVKNGSNVNMNVNGSVTPVNFSYTPTANFYLTAITFFLWHNGNTQANNFGALSSLTNGVQLKIRVSGTEYTILNMQSNIDVFNYFPNQATIPSTSGFTETADLYRGKMEIPFPMNLFVSSGDYVRFTIRDNLTGIDHMRATVTGYQVI